MGAGLHIRPPFAWAGAAAVRITNGMLEPGEPRGTADWLNPPSDEAGLRSYVATIRERRWIVAATVLIATAVALLYVATADKVYEAEAEVLVTPVSSQNSALVGLPLLFESSDPTRNVETAARLITTYDVAARVSEELDSRSPRRHSWRM